MAVQVIDSGDTDAILADAGVPIEKAPEAQAEGKEQQAETQAAEGDHGDNEEDENGLTAEQKKDLTDRMQKAIGKKHRALREAEEFAAAQYNQLKLAERQNEEMRLKLEALEGKNQPAEKKEQAKPAPGDFQSTEEYIEALADWRVDQKLREQAEANAKAAAEREQAALMESAKSRITRAVELVPDYDEVVSSVDVGVPPVVEEYMYRSEMFAELAYHMGKNPDVLLSLHKLTPKEQLVQIVKIESKLQPFGSKENDGSKKEGQNGAKPSTSENPRSENTGTLPSKARSDAPIITPLTATSSENIHMDANSIRGEIEKFSQKNKVNFDRRQRH